MKYGIEFAGAKRHARRDWRGTGVLVVTLLALAALCGWLWSCVRHAAAAQTVSTFPPLAVAPVTEGAVLGLLAFTMVVAVVLAARKIRADDAAERDVFAPLRVPGGPLPVDDVRRIVVACAAETRCVMKHVLRAQRTLSVEDYGDELALAERKLKALERCLESLVSRMSEEAES